MTLFLLGFICGIGAVLLFAAATIWVLFYPKRPCARSKTAPRLSN